MTGKISFPKSEMKGSCYEILSLPMLILENRALSEYTMNEGTFFFLYSDSNGLRKEFNPFICILIADHSFEFILAIIFLPFSPFFSVFCSVLFLFIHFYFYSFGIMYSYSIFLLL